MQNTHRRSLIPSLSLYLPSLTPESELFSTPRLNFPLHSADVCQGPAHLEITPRAATGVVTLTPTLCPFIALLSSQ